LILFAWVAPASAQGPPTFQNGNVHPDPFSPNGDGVRDVLTVEYTLESAADWVTGAVKNAEGALVVTLLNEVPQSAGTHILHWTGLDASMAPAPDGTYEVRLAAGNAWGQAEWNRTFTLDTTPAVARITEISPNPYAPDLPGSPDSLRVRVSVTKSHPEDFMSVTVGPNGEAAKDTLVLSPSFSGDGNYSCHWRDSGHEDGLYRVEAFMEDAAVNRSVDEGFFTLDKSPPFVEVYRPSGATLFSELPDSIFGRAFDGAGTASVQIAFDEGPFVAIAGAAGADTVYWASPLRDSLSEQGQHTVKIRATDLLGHVGAEGEADGFLSFDVTLDSQEPPPPSIQTLPSIVRSATLQVTGTAEDADSVAIYLNDFERPAAKAHVTINDTFSATLGLRPGANQIAATSVDEAGNQSALSPVMTVEYREEFGVFFNERFRPGDSFEISVDGVARKVTLALYSTSGRMVRILRGNGPSSTFRLTWDGQDSSGIALNTGVYLCRINAELEDGSSLTQKKLVALVR
jgi:flagellar hook assembly protein FlgD